jgi:L-alanine-DL-glutamate epimerase-like enolase superfamily enzyme
MSLANGDDRRRTIGASELGDMRISKVTTLRLGRYPNLCYVAIETDSGLVGLGETFFGARAVASWVHETAALYLLGKDPLAIELHSRSLEGFLGSTGTGTENRGRSAVDIALWDLFGKVTQVPLYQLLGGKSRATVRIYNTCAGPTYVRELPESPGLPVSNWSSPDPQPSGGGSSDLQAFLNDAGLLAKDLLGEGITAMKIWPFDEYADRSDGHSISNADLQAGLEPFSKVREAVGKDIEIIAELHSKWDLPCAVKIARALEPFMPAWVEDPLQMDSVDALAQFCSLTRIPTAASETVASSRAFHDLINRSGIQIVLFDPAWVGGITEARKVATLADARHLPIAAHDCAGPLNYVTGVHISCSQGNAFIQEGVRAFYRGWYRELVTQLPEVANGWVSPLEGPGLGTGLREEVWTWADAVIEVSTLSGDVGRPISAPA